jgi:hypothetical protein
VTSALTRRAWLLLVAGAVLVALLVNVVWVALGPGDGNDRGKVESAIRHAWTAKGTAPRSVTCTEVRSSWSCQVVSARGDKVDCPVGTVGTFLANPEAMLRASCHTQTVPQ